MILNVKGSRDLNKRTKQQYIDNHRTKENGEIERRCSACHEWKIENTKNFYLKKKSEPEKGFLAECKSCLSKRAYKNESKDKEFAKEVKHQYYENNKEKRLSDFKNRYNNKKDEWKIYHAQYLKNNKDKTKIYNENRLHKNHKINKKEWNDCKSYFNHECAYCGFLETEHYGTYRGVTKLHDLHKEHVDHFGSNDLSNCVPSCKYCNSEKHEKKLDDWYNISNPKYTVKRYDKILKWRNEDYAKYKTP